LAKGDAFNIGRVIQRTFGLIARNWLPFSLLGTLFAGLPYFLILVVYPLALSGSERFASVVPIGLGAIYLLGALSLQAVLTRASVDELGGARASLGASLWAGLVALFPMLGLVLFTGFVLLVALIAMSLFTGAAALGAGYVFVLAIWFGIFASLVYLFVRWIAVVPVTVIERSGVIQSLRRSSALTEGHRWAILGLAVLYAVATLVLHAVLNVVLPGAVVDLTRLPSSAAWYAPTAILVLVQIATSVIVAVGIAAIYFELRQIKEGVGVEELVQVFA
jgi:hypothetical protein